jgi:hypothetical protein
VVPPDTPGCRDTPFGNHCSNCSSVRQVLVLESTFFIKMNSAHSDSYCHILTILTQRVFWYRVTIFDHAGWHNTAKNICKPHETHWRTSRGPRVDNSCLRAFHRVCIFLVVIQHFFTACTIRYCCHIISFNSCRNMCWLTDVMQM